MRPRLRNRLIVRLLFVSQRSRFSVIFVRAADGERVSLGWTSRCIRSNVIHRVAQDESARCFAKVTAHRVNRAGSSSRKREPAGDDDASARTTVDRSHTSDIFRACYAIKAAKRRNNLISDLRRSSSREIERSRVT